MTVYLDDAMILWRGKRWCHLYADSLPELEAFAREIGLRPDWLQHPTGEAGLPHYDVTGMRLQAALELGATPVTSGDDPYIRLRQALGRGEYVLAPPEEKAAVSSHDPYGHKRVAELKTRAVQAEAEIKELSRELREALQGWADAEKRERELLALIAELLPWAGNRQPEYEARLAALHTTPSEGEK